MTVPSTSTLERYAFFALAAALGLIQVTITAEALFGVAAVLWLVIAIRERRRPAVPAFFLPLVLLAAWTLVSTAFSPDPMAGLRQDKQLVLYLLVPVTMRLARGARAGTAANVILAMGAVSALIGIVEYAALGFDTLQARPAGLLGYNYMTYSGVVMLVACAAVAHLLFRERREWIWPAVAVPALLAALAFSSSRNTWFGVVLAISVLVALKNWKWLAVIPIVLAAALAVAPAELRHRAWSALDPNDPTRRDRMAMLESGKLMIADHPLLGVGPNMVPRAYIEKYKTAGAVDPPDKPGADRAHLHNVPVQLAAERGLPAMAVWLWFVIVAARDLLRQVRRGPAIAPAATGLAALLAMLGAGLFEHNFGDSEFLFLLLGLITLPFAAASGLQSQDTDAGRRFSRPGNEHRRPASVS
jgi:putative inorganic carbon (HCO3(-)) transporter